MSIRRKLLALFAALVLMAGLGSNAYAGLAAVGPVDPVNGFPLWYQDTLGLKLGLCVGGVNCLSDPVIPAIPHSVQVGFGAEAFWWMAEALVGGPPPAPDARLTLAMEAAFPSSPVTAACPAGGCAAPGFESAFTRVRLRADGLPPGVTCTVIHPFSAPGGDAFLTDAAGSINVTNDVGCDAAGLGLGCNFTIPLNPVSAVSVFLRPVPGTPGIPVGFIGDAITPVQITGSPNGNNILTIDCPAAPPVFPVPVVLTQNLFVVQGKLFETLAVATAIAKGDFDGDGAPDLAAVGNNGTVGDTNSAWFSPGLGAWSRLTAPVGTTVAKVISGDFNNARLGDEIAIVTTNGQVFVYNDMLTATALPAAPLGTIVADIVAGDFNVARPGDEIAGIATDNRVLVAPAMTSLTATAAGRLAKVAAFNFDNIGTTDIIGLSAAGKVWFSTDIGTTWVNVPGTLASMTIGDFNNDGLDDLAGLSAAGKIWFTTDLATWTNTTGTLGKMTAGDFNAARLGDEFGGINTATRKIWIANTPVAAPGNSGWVTLAGTADELMYLGRLGSEISILNALSGKIWTSPDGIIWTIRNP